MVLVLACGDSGSGTNATSAASTSDAGSSTQPAPTSDPGPDTTGTPTSTPPTEGSNSNSNSTTAAADDTTAGLTSQGPGADPTTDTPQTSSTTAEPGSSSGGEESTGAAETGVVRFIASGDTREGNEAQYAVGQAIADLCAMKGCDFGMLLGDNFYDSGVSSVDDPQFQEKFELPYDEIEFPIYISLGNHDYGGNGLGVDFDQKKAQYQIDYTKKSQIWKLPAKYYTFKQEHAEFWGLDTNQVMTHPLNGNSNPQRDWLIDGTQKSTATWKIAFGHHPYISNGDHGNAGSYENIEGFNLPFVTGEKVKEFMDAAVCGKIDIYLAGHDHSIQWLEPKCGTEFIVSGAGAKAEDTPGKNPAYFSVANTSGFFWAELKDDSFTGTFYDQTGKELYTKTIVK